MPTLITLEEPKTPPASTRRGAKYLSPIRFLSPLQWLKGPTASSSVSLSSGEDVKTDAPPLAITASPLLEVTAPLLAPQLALRMRDLVRIQALEATVAAQKKEIALLQTIQAKDQALIDHLSTQASASIGSFAHKQEDLIKSFKALEHHLDSVPRDLWQVINKSTLIQCTISDLKEHQVKKLQSRDIFGSETKESNKDNSLSGPSSKEVANKAYWLRSEGKAPPAIPPSGSIFYTDSDSDEEH